MRYSFRIALLIAAAAAALVLAAERVSVADLMKDVDKYDGKVVIVSGKVTKFKAKISKIGNDYYNFKLEGKDRDDTVSVYGQGKLDKEPADGAFVEVTGKFAKETKVGSNIFKNEINLTKDRGDEKTKDFGIKVKTASGGS